MTALHAYLSLYWNTLVIELAVGAVVFLLWLAGRIAQRRSRGER